MVWGRGSSIRKHPMRWRSPECFEHFGLDLGSGQASSKVSSRCGPCIQGCVVGSSVYLKRLAQTLLPCAAFSLQPSSFSHCLCTPAPPNPQLPDQEVPNSLRVCVGGVRAWMEAESVGMPGWRPASRGGESSVAALAPRGQFCFPLLLLRPVALLSCCFWVIVAPAVPA